MLRTCVMYAMRATHMLFTVCLCCIFEIFPTLEYPWMVKGIFKCCSRSRVNLKTIENQYHHTGRNVRKLPSDMCAQQSLKSACAFAQSDLNLRCPHDETLHHLLSKMRPVKFPIRLCECGIGQNFIVDHRFCKTD